MSRVGKKPVPVPNGVTVTIDNGTVTVKGPKGTLTKEFNKDLSIKQEENEIVVERPNDTPVVRSLHGTTRALIANMIIGVSEGFSRSLELIGVGYRVAAKGKGLTLSLGYSHPVEIAPIDGIDFKVEGNNKITVEGIEKEVVGEKKERKHR